MEGGGRGGREGGVLKFSIDFICHIFHCFHVFIIVRVFSFFHCSFFHLCLNAFQFTKKRLHFSSCFFFFKFTFQFFFTFQCFPYFLTFVLIFFIFFILQFCFFDNFVMFFNFFISSICSISLFFSFFHSFFMFSCYHVFFIPFVSTPSGASMSWDTWVGGTYPLFFSFSFVRKKNDAPSVWGVSLEPCLLFLLACCCFVFRTTLRAPALPQIPREQEGGRDDCFDSRLMSLNKK